MILKWSRQSIVRESLSQFDNSHERAAQGNSLRDMTQRLHLELGGFSSIFISELQVQSQIDIFLNGIPTTDFAISESDVLTFSAIANYKKFRIMDDSNS